ncbi:MAG TPA: hypothetical protein VGB31_05520 [Myxococcota bacterium]
MSRRRAPAIIRKKTSEEVVEKVWCWNRSHYHQVPTGATLHTPADACRVIPFDVGVMPNA